MDEGQRSEFWAAVQRSDTERVQALLAAEPALAAATNPDWFDAQALVNAATRADLAMIGVLLEGGADINAKSRWWAGGWSALHHAVDRLNTALAQQLLEHCAEIDVHSAAGLGRAERLQGLLDADPALVHLRGPDGILPLHFASTIEVADLLLQRGAEIDARDLDHGGTAAQWMLRGRHDVCRFLIARGATTDIFMDCALGELGRVEQALRRDPRLLHAETCTPPFMPAPAPGDHIYAYVLAGRAAPLHVAARRGRRDVVDLLLAHGAEINAKAGGSTPLHGAAFGGQLEMVRYLLSLGADPAIRDDEHHGTPLGWAEHGGRTEVAAYLRTLE